MTGKGEQDHRGDGQESPGSGARLVEGWLCHVRRNMAGRRGGVHRPRGWIAAFVGLVLLGACTPPDTPPALGRRLPEAVVEMLHPDTVRSARIAAGVWYRYVWSSEGPWAIHTVEADLTRCDLGLAVLRAEARESGRGGRETVTSMVSRQGGGILAAVNADFFTREGGTVGTEVVKGQVVTARSRPAFAWRIGALPWMGSVTVQGDSLVLGWRVHRGNGDGATMAVGGFPDLIDAGVRVGDLQVTDRPSFAAGRHPRTAVAYDAAAERLWLVVVDGRQVPHAAGMTLPELVTLLEALGATEALNLDGGGSSVMIVHGRAASHPSDPAGERPVVNALALARDFAACGN